MDKHYLCGFNTEAQKVLYGILAKIINNKPCHLYHTFHSSNDLLAVNDAIYYHFANGALLESDSR